MNERMAVWINSRAGEICAAEPGTGVQPVCILVITVEWKLIEKKKRNSFWLAGQRGIHACVRERGMCTREQRHVDCQLMAQIKAGVSGGMCEHWAFPQSPVACWGVSFTG